MILKTTKKSRDGSGSGSGSGTGTGTGQSCKPLIQEADFIIQ
jgi:hypothetical protein